MRRAARVDENQSAVVIALRACGCEVQSMAAIGKGVPDLLVSYRNQLLLLELKDGSKPPSARKLTPAQIEWHKRWPVHVVTSVEDAIELLSKM
jgi:hypothetical protein